jgi:hypothetical protein
MNRITNYCCCTQTVKCRYCIRANLEPFIFPKEQVNELENMINTKMNTQNIAIQAIKDNKYIVGSFNEAGELSFNPTPVLHEDKITARAECRRLAKIFTGKLYLFVQLSGAEMLPANNISI